MYERLPIAGNTVTVSYHRTYSDYINFLKAKEEHSFVNVDSIKSYIVDLEDKMRCLFRPLTFSTLADDILRQNGEKKRKKTKRETSSP